MSPKLKQAIQAIKAGDKETGKQLLVELLEVERRNDQVWLWLAEVLDTDEERIKSLQNVLKLNPDNDIARERLEAILSPPPVQAEDEVVFEDDFTFEDQPGFEDEAAFEDQPGFEDEVEFGDQPVYLDEDEDETEFEDGAEYEDGVEFEDEGELDESAPATSHPLIEQFKAADNQQKLMIIVPVVVVVFCTSCCLLGVVANFFFSSGTEQAAVEAAPVVEGTDTPVPSPTLPSGLVLPPAETDVLPTAPLEPTPINTPVVPPTGTPSTTPAPTDTPLPAAAEGEGTPPPPPTFQEAQVLEVIDGDTIRVSLDGTEYTVDYLLIDTPETTDPAQLFGPEAADFNRVLLEGKTVRLEEDASRIGPDGHLLRYVWFGELLVNEEILRQGLAKVVPSPTDLRHLERFLAVQSEAQAAGIGLWSSAANPPTPPPLVDETPDGGSSEHNADLGN